VAPGALPPSRAGLFQEKHDSGTRCRLCPHQCIVAEGKTGICGVRKTVGGTLWSLSYGRPCAMAVDPVEKKPLFHFLPGSSAFSYATQGCNLACSFCQNHSISQAGHEPRPGPAVPAEALAREAADNGCALVAHTYSEPTVYFEYALDVATAARALGIRNVFVTNGYILAEPLAMLTGLLDGANVDLKSFSEKTYKEVCGGHLQPVLDTIARMVRAGVWVEVTTLVVPGLNDSDAELADIASFLASVSRSIPWHVSAFHPDFRMRDRPATPAATLSRALDAGRRAGLAYVYAGNLSIPGAEDTRCPSCRGLLVGRNRYRVTALRVTAGGLCPDCSNPVPGLWG
jgi:pyruvate formate lyase activating enzyme